MTRFPHAGPHRGKKKKLYCIDPCVARGKNICGVYNFVILVNSIFYTKLKNVLFAVINFGENVFLLK